jgi:RNA polymerase sigma factor (sigma-70 family)
VTEERPDTVETLAARDADREAALADLFHRHHLELVRLATLLGAESDAEDVVADAFCELHRGWKRLRSAQAALPYLRAVIVNLVRMRVRHLQVVRKHVEWVRGDVASAEAQAMVRDDQRALVAALRELPERQREALVLRYWLSLKEVEIAEAMGISAGAVKAHTARGMAKLGKVLEAQGDD